MAQLASHRVLDSRSASYLNIGACLAKAIAWLKQALEVSRQRRALYRLDDMALSDLGLSRADAWQEADRPFWEQPAEESGHRSC